MGVNVRIFPVSSQDEIDKQTLAVYPSPRRRGRSLDTARCRAMGGLPIIAFGAVHVVMLQGQDA
jgi:hypothetical protein